MGFDAVYNWFSTVSSGGGLSSIFSSGGQGGLGGIFGSGGLPGGSQGSALSSLSPLGMVCKAPQLRPSPNHEDASPARRDLGASPVRIHATLSPRRDAASSSSTGPGPQSASDAGGGATPSRRSSRTCAYEVVMEDLIDQHVGYYLRHHPHILATHAIVRKRAGVYDLDGREIKVEWQHSSEPGGPGFLVALDGPLRQPFDDYMEMSEANAEYDSEGIGSKSALHSIPKEKRMSFQDQHRVYNRLEAMKVAKEQALVRERAADFVKDGREVPCDLMVKYKKSIQQKLDPGGRRASAAARQRSQEVMANAASPGAQAAGAGGSTPVRTAAAALPHPGAATPQPPAPGPGPGGGGATPGGGPVPVHPVPEDASGPPTNRSLGGDFAVPTADVPDTVALSSLEGLGSLGGSTGATTPSGHRGGDSAARFAGQGQPPERQFSGPIFAAPEQRVAPARPRARTQSPESRQRYQWPSYVPPPGLDGSGASYVPPPLSQPDGRSGSYVPPPVTRDARGASGAPPLLHEGLSRSYVPPASLEFQGGPPEERSVSNDWTGTGAFARAPPGAGPTSGSGSGGGSPHSQGPPGGGWQASTPGGGRSSAAQRLGPQPAVFGTPLGGAHGGQSPLGSRPMAPGFGLGGSPGPGGAPPQPPPQYAWWQQ